MRDRFTEGDALLGVAVGDALTPALFERLLADEHDKLVRATNRDVHDDSKRTTLPIARLIVEHYVMSPVKMPWYVDLLNLNLDDHDATRARARIEAFMTSFSRDGTRLTDAAIIAAP